MFRTYMVLMYVNHFLKEIGIFPLHATKLLTL